MCTGRLFNCTPAQLPPDVKANLTTLLRRGGTDLEGFIRPGCTHLTVDVVLNAEEVAAVRALGVRGVVRDMLQQDGSEFWKRQTAMVCSLAFNSALSTGNVQGAAAAERGAVKARGSQCRQRQLAALYVVYLCDWSIGTMHKAMKSLTVQNNAIDDK